jgi:hypothetical protein
MEHDAVLTWGLGGPGCVCHDNRHMWVKAALAAV